MMRGSAFDFVGNLDTLVAVIVGAALATVGGIVGEHFEDRIARRRNARDAARFFAEIMGSIDALVARGMDSQEIGERWGPVSMRMFRSALKEAEIYERNRERLFEIGDEELRRSIHTHLISEIFPLEAMVDYSDEISRLNDRLEDEPAMPAARREKLEKRIAQITESRDNARAFIVSECEKTGPLCTELLALAQNGGRRAPNREDQAGNS